MRTLALLALTTVLHAAEPGHEERSIEGWRVIVEQSLAEQDPDTLAAALAVLRAQLQAIVRVVPRPALDRIQAVPIWVHRHSGTRCMAFHPSESWLAGHGFNPHMADSIEIGDVDTFLQWTKQQPWMVLHELAHAYQFRVLGFENAEIERCWDEAVASGKYDQVLNVSGRIVKHYALQNAKEYFAELTESYFGTNDFFPFVRAELQKHDPHGYELIRRMWTQP